MVTLAQHCSRHRVKTVSYHTATILYSELIYEQPRSLQKSYQGRGKKAEWTLTAKGTNLVMVIVVSMIVLFFSNAVMKY